MTEKDFTYRMYYKGSDGAKMATSQEGVRDGCLRIAGVLGKVDVVNDNNRYYERSHYQMHIDELMERVKSEGVFGEYRHPKEMHVNWDRMTHMVERVWIDNEGFVQGTFILLNTEYGRLAQEIALQGGRLRASSRGLGRIGKDGVVTLSQMYTFDLVDRAGFEKYTDMRIVGAKKPLSESISENGMVLETYELNTDEPAKSQILSNISEAYKSTNDLGERAKLVSETYVKHIPKKDEEMNNKQLTASISEMLEYKYSQLETIFESKLSEMSKRIDGINTELTKKVDEAFSALPTHISQDDVHEIFETRKLHLLQGIQNYLSTDFLGEVDEKIETSISENTDAILSAVEAQHTDGLLGVDESISDLRESVTDEINQVSEANNNKLLFGIQNWVREDVVRPLNENIHTTFGGSLTNVNEGAANVDLDDIDAIINNAYSIGDEVANEGANELPIVLKYIPKALKAIYESFDYQTRTEIVESAKVYQLDNEADVQMFWRKQNLVHKRETMDLQKQNPTAQIQESGLSPEFISKLKSQF